MVEPPSGRCGYTFPENYDPDVVSTAYQQSCCYRRALPDADRCAWHADPAETSEKSIEALREARAPPEVREQNTFDGGVHDSSYGELLDGAVLRGMTIEDEFSFSSVTLRSSDLENADLRGADFEQANLALWPATMANATLRGANFAGAELMEVDLSGSYLREADLTEANCRRADFATANLREVDLTEANSTEADFAAADLREAEFTEVELRDADLSETTLGGADFADADVSRATFRGADADEQVFFDDVTGTGVDFRDARLFVPVLAGAELDGADLTDATLFGATLSDASLEAAELVRASLVEAALDEANLSEADLTEAALRDADLTGATLVDATLADAGLTEATLTGADFTGADLTAADLPGRGDLGLRTANLTRATLAGQDLREYELSGATLTKADLTGADLSDADLYEADLERALLSRADLFNTRLERALLDGAAVGDVHINERTLELMASEATDDGDLDVVTSCVTLLRGPTGPDEYRCVYDPKGPGDDPVEPDDADDPPEVRAAGIYRAFEQLATDNALPKWQRRFFILRQDMQTRRDRKKGQHLSYGFSVLLRTVFGYGEEFDRVIGWSAGIIGFFALMYLAGGWISPVRPDGTLGPPVSWTRLPEAPGVLWESIYYSTLTFTALGFGDFRPTSTLGQLFTVAETAIGAVLLALLVFVLGRRAAR